MTMWDMLSEGRVQGSSAMVECLETVSGAGHLIRSTQYTDSRSLQLTISCTVNIKSEENIIPESVWV